MGGDLGSVPVVVSGFAGSLVAGLATGIGALPIFLRAEWSRTARMLMLAAAAGIMLGATVFSLMVPALEMVTSRTGSELQSVAVVGAGLLLGAGAVWLIHTLVPHQHFIKGREGRGTVGLGSSWLFILAITIHNFPEGMTVGVAYGAEAATGMAVTIGIGLQNIPEGLAVAAALIGDGFNRVRAFWIALLTGLVEPVGGLVGAAAVSVSDALLPWGMSFAAGAMLFVVSGEIIPETHREGVERAATFSLVLGFIVMMILDVVFS